MDIFEEAVKNFNESVGIMFEDQRDILRNSNIIMTGEVGGNAYLWFDAGKMIQFWRNYESITIGGCKQKPIPVVYVCGLPSSGWCFDHHDLRMKVSGIIPQLKYDRQYRHGC